MSLVENNYYYGLAKLAANVAGYPVQPLWIYAQWLHESNGFTDPKVTEIHNFAGVTTEHENDYPQPDGAYYYMKFSDDYEFAQYFGRYLRLYRVDGLSAVTNMEEYAQTLKNGGYYGDSYENYIGGMYRWLRGEN